MGDPLATALADERIQRAEAYRAADEFAAAAEELECALRLEGPLELPLEAEIRLRLADLLQDQDSHEEAKRALQPLIDGPDPWRSRANFFWAWSLLNTGELESVETLCRAVIPVFEEHNLRLDLAKAKFMLATAYIELGRHEDSATLHREALVLAGEIEDYQRVARYRGGLALLHSKLSEYRTAAKLYGRSLGYYVEQGDSNGIALTQLNLSVCWLRLGEVKLCEISLRESERCYLRLNRTKGLTTVTNVRGLLALARGRRDEARSHFEEARRSAARISYLRGEHEAILGISDCLWAEHDFASARELVRGSVAVWRGEAKGGDLHIMGLRRLGRLELALGNARAAREALERALSLATASLVPRAIALVRVELARLLAAEDRPRDARVEFSEAWQQINQLELPFDAAYAESVAAHAGIPIVTTRTARIPVSFAPEDLIVASDSSLALLALADRLADYEGSVLIHGEPGVGKATLARVTHAIRYERSGGILEFFELTSPEEASRMAELPPNSTVFLRALHLQEPEEQAAIFRALTVLESTRGDLRVICTAEGDIEYLVTTGYAAELGYRLGSFEVPILPLRERPEDLVEMSSTFATGAISADAIAELHLHDWPGNVRELRNAMSAARFLAGDAEIKPEHLPASIRPTVPLTLQDRVAEVEREAIGRAMRYTDGNKKAAAEILGVSRKGLSDRIRRLEL